jgi:hypothetical protein
MSFAMRYFAADPASYEDFRLAVDLAWGLPSHGQLTALPPGADCPQLGGKVYMAARADHCQYEPIATMLPTLMQGGKCVEVSEADYVAACLAMPCPIC